MSEHWPIWLEDAMRTMTPEEKKRAIRIYQSGFQYKVGELRKGFRELGEALRIPQIMRALARYLNRHPRLVKFVDTYGPAVDAALYFLIAMKYLIAIGLLVLLALGMLPK